ncbi:MAG: hypothetical protein E6K82_17660, partial [Candidatus Rokuibacteriota bacterium]
MTALSFVGLLVAGWLVMVVNEWFPVLRLESPTQNAVGLLVAYALPWLALAVTLRRLQRWRRTAALLLLVMPIAYTLIFTPLVVMHLLTVRTDHDKDRSFQRVAAIPVDGGRISVYRSDCGAACGSESIAVRHERRLVRGVLLVRRL